MVTVEDFSRLVSGVYAAAVAQPITAVLRQLYGFTNTESEIALRLAHGADLRRISDELSISLTTVRTHLQHAFDKTNTHRQAELVQQLLAVSL
jgi:DNA-binding CsgD family transcriptional regulator